MVSRFLWYLPLIFLSPPCHSSRPYHPLSPTLKSGQSPLFKIPHDFRTDRQSERQHIDGRTDIEYSTDIYSGVISFGKELNMAGWSVGKSIHLNKKEIIEILFLTKSAQLELSIQQDMVSSYTTSQLLKFQYINQNSYSICSNTVQFQSPNISSQPNIITQTLNYSNVNISADITDTEMVQTPKVLNWSSPT